MSQPFNFFPPDLAGNSHPKHSTLQSGAGLCARMTAPRVGVQLYGCGVGQVRFAEAGQEPFRLTSDNAVIANDAAFVLLSRPAFCALRCAARRERNFSPTCRCKLLQGSWESIANREMAPWCHWLGTFEVFPACPPGKHYSTYRCKRFGLSLEAEL